MEILAHRGLWNKIEEKNTMSSLTRAFEHGMGIETDVRDDRGELVISHDIPNEDCILLERLLEEYRKRGFHQPLAINIKADGLQDKIAKLIVKYEISRYFVFDMSIPEMVQYRKAGIRFFCRSSDIESECVLYKDASGVWVDSFYQKDWISAEKIRKFIEDHKEVGIISPEIHGFNEEKLWKEIKLMSAEGMELMLCTDKGKLAKEYFRL